MVHSILAAEIFLTEGSEHGIELDFVRVDHRRPGKALCHRKGNHFFFRHGRSPPFSFPIVRPGVREVKQKDHRLHFPAEMV